MHIVSVILENYGAYYGRHDFYVADRGLVLVVGENKDEPRMDSNGSAKSTIFEAMDWALFGVVSKGDHADSVVHDDAKSCGVVVTIQNDFGEVGEVARGRPSSLSFQVDGQDRGATDPRETQAVINQWLGLDREVFHAAVFFGQEDLRHFADAKDAQRMEILSRIIPELGEIDGLLERAKARKKNEEPIHYAAKEMADSLAGELTALEKIDFAAQIQEWDANRQARVAGLERQLSEKWGKMNECKRIASKGDSLSVQIQQLEQRVQVTIPTTIEGLDGVRNSLAYSREQYAVVRGEMRQFEEQIQRVNQTGTGRCPACGSTVSQEHLAYETQRLTQEITARSQTVTRLHQEGTALANQEASLLAQLAQQNTQAQLDQRSNNELLSRAREELAGVQQAIRQLHDLEREAALLQQTLQTETVQENPFKAKQRETQARILQLRVEWHTAKVKEEESAHALKLYEFWVDAFRPHGIKSLILDTKLQELTDAANEWVLLLTGGTMWVRFESQKMGRSTKTLRNAPNIRVFRYRPDGGITERNYSSWSGGEKRRVSWAIDFGLSRLVARRATQKWDLLVLDEVFKHVDAKGGEAVVEMLTQLQREKSSIFVIEHDSSFQSHFETVITARKERGRSRIVEADNGDQGQTEIQLRRDGTESGDGGTMPTKPKARKKRKARNRRVPPRPDVR
jgi:DNA repair exonuclease SbcCD ATPase subunit